MEEEGQEGEKTEEPSMHRIEEFRKRGDVAQSRELTNAIVLGSCFFIIALSIGFAFEKFKDYILFFMDVTTEYAFSEEGKSEILQRTLDVILYTAGPILIVSLLTGVITTVSQIGFLFSSEVLNLKWERINPISGFKRIFSIRSLVEALKGLFKFIFIISICYWMLSDKLFNLHGLMHLSASSSFAYGNDIILKLAYAIIAGLLIIAIFDFTYQRISYMNRLRQTKEGAKREAKEKDGNPEIKQRIKTIQREMAQKRMMAEVPGADVIVTNPTHLSVALKYDSEKMISPEVVAKGADEVALKIREIAKENKVPIVENVPLARALYKTVKVDEAVPRTLYKAVAEVLAFVYRLKRKRKGLS